MHGYWAHYMLSKTHHKVSYADNSTQTNVIKFTTNTVLGGLFGVGLYYTALRHNMELEKQNYAFRNVLKRMISTNASKRRLAGFALGGGLMGYILF